MVSFPLSTNKLQRAMVLGLIAVVPMIFTACGTPGSTLGTPAKIGPVPLPTSTADSPTTSGWGDHNWGDNEQLGNYIDDHHFCNYNKRINNGWFHNEWDDNQHLDQRINRHDRYRHDI